MMRTSTLVLFPCGLLGAALQCHMAPCQHPDKDKTTIDSLVGAATPREAAKAFRELTGKLDKGRSQELKAFDNDGIALRFAWYELLQSIDREQQSHSTAVNKETLQRFLGFVEGRLRTSLPGWWEHGVLGAKSFGRTNVFFAAERDSSPYQTIIDGIRSPKHISMRSRSGKSVLAIGDKTVSLPEAFIKSLAQIPGCSVTAHSEEHEAYIAAHSDRTTPYTLACIERLSAKEVWIAPVWAGGGIGGYSGQGWHWVAVRRINESVIVFGLGNDCAYIEGFNAKNGRNIFRFSTGY